MRRHLPFWALLLLWPLAADFDAAENFRAAMVALREKNFYAARLLLQEIVLKDPRGEYGDDAQYYLAMAYFYEGDYRTAQFEFRALLRDYPQSPFAVRAEFWNGEAWFQRKNYREALAAHSAFVRKYRENILSASALYTIGYIYNEQKRYDEAIQEFRRALRDYPESPVAAAIQLQLGIALFNSGDYPAARRSFEQILVKYAEAENLDAARFWLGKSYYAENKSNEALTHFLAIERDFPQSALIPESLYLAALCHYRLGQKEKAHALLARVVNNFPQSAIYPFVRLRQAQLWHEEANLKAALAPLLDILNYHRQHETFAAAVSLYAEIRKKQNQTDEAIAALEALLNEPDASGKIREEILLRIAELLYSSKRFTESAEKYGILLREFGQGEKEVAYRLNLARAHVGAGKYEAALQALAGVEKKADDPSAAEALFLRAEIAYQQGKFPEALQFYARFTRKYRNHPRRAEAELGIGWTYFELKQFARAADQFRTLIQTAPAPWRSKALLALGACQYNLRDFSGAEQSYRQVLAEHADQPTDYAEALYQLGWLFFRRNQPKEARDHFRRYLAGGHAQPRRHEAAYFSAFCLFQTNDFAGAENEFLVLLRNEDLPQWLKEKALADLARSRSSQKKYSAARADWQKLLQDSAQSPLAEEAHYQIATLSLQLGEEEAALSAMAQLREKNPSSTWLKEGLAELFVYFRNKKDFARATAILQELGKLRQNPEEKAELRLKKSELLIAEGKTSEAEAILNAVLADPDVADGHKLHALAMLTALWENSGRFAEAVAKIEKLAERFPKEESIVAELQFAAGRFLFLAGQHAEAAQKLTGLARRREIADRSRFLLGEIALAQKKTALAIDYFRQVSQKTDQALWLKARLRIGEILYTQKDFEEAAREFSRISYAETREDAVYEKSLYYAMLCFKALGKSREAEVFHNRLKEAFPHSPFLKETD